MKKSPSYSGAHATQFLSQGNQHYQIPEYIPLESFIPDNPLCIYTYLHMYAYTYVCTPYIYLCTYLYIYTHILPLSGEKEGILLQVPLGVLQFWGHKESQT